MQIIGLTGSIASGKSTIRCMCHHLGAATIDADDIVHALLAPGGKAVRDVAACFPETLVDSAIDRKQLAARVFADSHKLDQLESLLHPMVRKEIHRWMNRQRCIGKPYVVIEVPLLFEANMQRDYHHIIVTAASQPCINKRLLARPGMTESKQRSILARQWPQAKKIAHADTVIYTGLGKGYSMRALKAFFNKTKTTHYHGFII